MLRTSRPLNESTMCSQPLLQIRLDTVICGVDPADCWPRTCGPAQGRHQAVVEPTLREGQAGHVRQLLCTCQANTFSTHSCAMRPRWLDCNKRFHKVTRCANAPANARLRHRIRDGLACSTDAPSVWQCLALATWALGVQRARRLPDVVPRL